MTFWWSFTFWPRIWETWIRPFSWMPMSTKAPKAVTFVTIPGSSIPGLRSSISWISSAKLNSWALWRGSRPGLANSFRISLIVGRPNSPSHVGRRIDLIDQLLISDQFLGADSEVRSHPVNDVIALWVHG